MHVYKGFLGFWGFPRSNHSIYATSWKRTTDDDDRERDSQLQWTTKNIKMRAEYDDDGDDNDDNDSQHPEKKLDILKCPYTSVLHVYKLHLFLGF